MPMGTTGTVKVTHEMMDNALKAIEDYRSEITDLNSQLDGVINDLIPTSFSGSAAEGFKTFYGESIEPNCGENLTKMLDSLKGICESVKKQIPGEEDGVDDQLGQGNQGAGGQGT